MWGLLAMAALSCGGPSPICDAVRLRQLIKMQSLCVTFTSVVRDIMRYAVRQYLHVKF